MILVICMAHIEQYCRCSIFYHRVQSSFWVIRGQMAIKPCNHSFLRRVIMMDLYLMVWMPKHEFQVPFVILLSSKVIQGHARFKLLQNETQKTKPWLHACMGPQDFSNGKCGPPTKMIENPLPQGNFEESHIYHADVPHEEQECFKGKICICFGENFHIF